MYVPKHFEETDRNKIAALIEQHPLATLVLTSADNLMVNHIPFYFDGGFGVLGRLLGHVPRANPLSATVGPTQSLAIFHGVSSYITPNWYPTKNESGRVVPTWNYQVVHVYGRLSIVDDRDWVCSQITALTDHNEKNFVQPWKMTDAPEAYTNGLIKMLVGIEIEITELDAKSKVSQNQSEANRAGVIKGLSNSHRTSDREMAEIIRSASED